MSETDQHEGEWTRRDFVNTAVATGVAASGLIAEAEGQTPAGALPTIGYELKINGENHEFTLDPRVTLLDLLRERLHLTGTKKGCDHGQCGACTVLVNGKRLNSCLALAVSYSGAEVTTIEGLSAAGQLHPMQEAFLDKDGFQCGYCTPGQICSAVALLEEWRANVPSAVTPREARSAPEELSNDEIRERMAGNLCRCGAYSGIVEAVRAVSRRSPA